MRRASTALTLLPFALVVVLAVGLAIAGRLSTHDSVTVGTATPTPSAVPQSPTSAPLSPTPGVTGPSASVTASPANQTASPAASARANDATEMLRVHNELRAAVAAPIVRADDRVTTAAQRHAEYLAQNNALGHDEMPGSPGFTGASVRDRLAAQGYNDANASEVATSFISGTEGVRSLWVLPSRFRTRWSRAGAMHRQRAAPSPLV